MAPRPRAPRPRPFRLAAFALALACGGGGGGHGGGAGTCGNGVVEGQEQCDDGNTAALDGCDASCRYELFLRMTSLAIQGTKAPSSCTPATNRLGSQVLTSFALGQLNTGIQDAVDAGDLDVLVQLRGLEDLTGASDADGLEAGILGAQLDPARGAWTGRTLDWWLLADPRGLDASDLPLVRIGNGILAARALELGPSDAALPLSLGDAVATMRLRSMRITSTLDGTPAPDVPAPPPEALGKGLRVLQRMTASGAGQGVCGNVTVESLAQIPVPEMLAAGGSAACSAACGSFSYTYCGAGQPVGPGCNSLLDVIVGGCTVRASVLGTPVCVAAVNAQQPDVPGVAGGAVATLTPGPGNEIPAAQTEGNQDGYSAYLRFDATRVHVTGKAP